MNDYFFFSAPQLKRDPLGGALVSSTPSPLVLLVLWAALNAGERKEQTSLVDRVYPYLVTAAYPESKVGVEPPIGNGIRATVVVDVDGLVHSLTNGDLQALGMPWDSVRARALGNLDRLARERKIALRVFDKGPGGQPFILVGGHWGAAALILSPQLRSVAARALQTTELCASIPHSGALLVFRKGDRASRDAMRHMIRSQEAGEPKPLTWALFELTESGPKPFVE